MTPPARSNGSRTVLIVLGAVGLCALCCCGGLGGLAFVGLRRGQRDDREAKAFARDALLAAGKDWRMESLRPYLAPTYLQGVPERQTATALAAYARKLGPLRTLGSFRSSRFSYGSGYGMPSGDRVAMSVRARFAKADGVAYVNVAKLGGRWGIESFRVDSPAFLK